MTDAAASNPVLQPWSGPHGGVPAFDQVRVEMFAPALEQAMAQYRAEIAAIATNPEAPSFANTLEALERSGGAYRRATSCCGHQAAKSGLSAARCASRASNAGVPT